MIFSLQSDNAIYISYLHPYWIKLETINQENIFFISRFISKTWMKLTENRTVAETVSRWLPTAAARVRAGTGKWDLWWTKWRRGKFSPSTLVSPAKTVHSTNFSILTITRSRYNRPGVAAVPSGPSMDSTPQYWNKKRALKFDFVLGLYI
jgi:hypothetical protein